ncbi:MAG TPA: diguanylate cyclase [Ramlibacter sp.]|nr:diguanylate cyclase [Ramlibacter sp.]
MQMWAIGFWGAYFGTVALLLAGSMLAFFKSHHRVALAAATSALISALFVVGYLGWLPIADPAVENRVLSHIAIVSAAVLGLLLWAMLGLLRPAAAARRIRLWVATLAIAGMVAGWLLDAWHALALGSVVAFGIGVAGVLIAARSARRGDPLAWVGVLGIAFMLVSLGGLSWIALDRSGVPVAVHLVSAVAATAYLVAMGSMMWQRYSYLIELREVLAQGPSYDPITRMRSNAETGNMVGIAFYRQQQDPTRPVGVIAVSIGNFFALEQLHGKAAVNHALFVCASRLRRCVPADVEMGRLSEDGFLLVTRNASDMQRLVQLGRTVAQRLSRPVALSTSAAAGDLEAGKAQWAAQVGVGLIATTANSRPSSVVAMARDMSRTAWSYTSRVAWHDLASGQIAELPATEAV